MELRIAIVDDLPEDRARLEKCVRRFFQADQAPAADVHVDLFARAEDFLPVFAPGTYGLAFLDICMDEMDGIELAGELRGQDPHLLIVFQTTAAEYAFDAFPLHPFDYVMKPCEQERIDRVLSEALRVLSVGDPAIKVTAARASYSVPLRSIVAATSKGHNTELFLTNNQHLTCTESFKSISAKLAEDARFLDINRGIVVNMDHVLMPESDAMHMKDDTLYPIRVNGRAGVLSAFSQYMISKVASKDGRWM